MDASSLAIAAVPIAAVLATAAAVWFVVSGRQTSSSSTPPPPPVLKSTKVTPKKKRRKAATTKNDKDALFLLSDQLPSSPSPAPVTAAPVPTQKQSKKQPKSSKPAPKQKQQQQHDEDSEVDVVPENVEEEEVAWVAVPVTSTGRSRGPRRVVKDDNLWAKFATPESRALATGTPPARGRLHGSAPLADALVDQRDPDDSDDDDSQQEPKPVIRVLTLGSAPPRPPPPVRRYDPPPPSKSTRRHQRQREEQKAERAAAEAERQRGLYQYRLDRMRADDKAAEAKRTGKPRSEPAASNGGAIWRTGSGSVVADDSNAWRSSGSTPPSNTSTEDQVAADFLWRTA
ncbi:hypothetical protein BC828DRAFT_391912 [Blastocladiella britannica]|nr:hypothetical protein BC828DRAFT_391912 [Blastocladiella britannica]